jgi:hypothetical protein
VPRVRRPRSALRCPARPRRTTARSSLACAQPPGGKPHDDAAPQRSTRVTPSA